MIWCWHWLFATFFFLLVQSIWIHLLLKSLSVLPPDTAPDVGFGVLLCNLFVPPAQASQIWWSCTPLCFFFNDFLACKCSHHWFSAKEHIRWPIHWNSYHSKFIENLWNHFHRNPHCCHLTTKDWTFCGGLMFAKPNDLATSATLPLSFQVHLVRSWVHDPIVCNNTTILLFCDLRVIQHTAWSASTKHETFTGSLG